MQSQENVTTESARPASILEGISDEAQRIGVTLDTWEDADRVDLHWIARHPGAAAGSGGHIMDLLCAYADRTYRYMLLKVEDEAMTATYAQWGFVDLPNEDREDYFPNWRQMMIRRPVRFGIA